MPTPLEHQTTREEEESTETNTYCEDESYIPRDKARKFRERSRRKHEQGGEASKKEILPKSAPRELTPSPLLVHDPHPPTHAPRDPIAGTSPPVFAPLEHLPSAASLADTSGEWTNRNLYSGSPPAGRTNGVGIAASPPVASGHQGGFHGGFSNASPPISPRLIYRQPLRRTHGYQSSGDYLGSSPGHGRPTSVHSPYSQYPPLPHHLQPHFYGAPGIDLASSKPPSERRAGDGYFCGFDSLSSTRVNTSGATENVLLVGSEGALDVYRVSSKDKPSLVGKLNGLRGGVIAAKILPSWAQKDGLRPIRPLVALVIHGPQFNTSPSYQDRPRSSNSEDVLIDSSDSVMQAMEAVHGAPSTSPVHYQTTVEVYSLKERKYIATLFSTPTVEVERSLDNSHISAPDPIGKLSVQANGRFIVVASGTSGEVYVFETESTAERQETIRFRCIGKVWTTVPPQKPRSWSTSSSSSDVDDLPDRSSKVARPDAGILSLSQRWLAIVPPTSSARSTIHGVVEIFSAPEPPGLTSHTAPTQPNVTCDLDTPDGESFLNQVARDVTQEILRGARWMGDQGIQVWKNYWNKTSDVSPHVSGDVRVAKSDHVAHIAQTYHAEQSFPPTHAHEDNSTRVNNQAALVSILDLERLSENRDSKTNAALQPVATFSIPHGCSYVSFAPNGLSLLSASAKGDVQHVWDLMRLLHGRYGLFLSAGNDRETSRYGPVVRQIACFTRMTIANIVDVQWTEPSGERVAIVTDRGTVHIFDLPSSAFQWPPPRRSTRPATASGPANTDDLHSPSNPMVEPGGSKLTVAMNMVNLRTQPLLAAVRTMPPSIGNPFSGMNGLNFTAGASAKGSKAVAAGFSKSVGAASGTVNTIRHLGENRLHVPSGGTSISPGCAKWLSGRDKNLIAVVGGGILKTYAIHSGTSVKARQRRPSVISGRAVEFVLPRIPDEVVAPAARKYLASPGKDIALLSLGGHWSSHLLNQDYAGGNAHPLSYAEIQTNAPYQPFHTDRRIDLYRYDDNTDNHLSRWRTDPHLKNQSSLPWAFGDVIPSVRISVGSSNDLDNTDHREAMTGDQVYRQFPRRDGQIENLISFDGIDEGRGEEQRIVVTTRRKRGRGGARDDVVDEEEFFEDDCEVVDFAEDRV